VRLAVGVLLLVFLLNPRPLGAQSLHETIEKVRVCSLLRDDERHQCLEKALANPLPPIAAPATAPAIESPAAPPAVPAAAPTRMPAESRAADSWIVSETTSPIDYSPVVVATAEARARPDGPALRLSIQCRAGRTDLAISGAALSQRADDYSASYAVNGNRPVPVAVAVASPGPGLAIKANVVGLLATLPDQGDVIFRVDRAQATTLEGRFALPALKGVLDRLAVPCRWPRPAGRPTESPNGPIRRSP
jgi:hypothetical protein